MPLAFRPSEKIWKNILSMEKVEGKFGVSCGGNVGTPHFLHAACICIILHNFNRKNPPYFFHTKGSFLQFFNYNFLIIILKFCFRDRCFGCICRFCCLRGSLILLQSIMHAHQMVDFRAHFGMLAQELLCVFTPLPDTGFLIGIPCAALIYDIHICRQIQNIPPP